MRARPAAVARAEDSHVASRSIPGACRRGALSSRPRDRPSSDPSRHAALFALVAWRALAGCASTADPLAVPVASDGAVATAQASAAAGRVGPLRLVTLGDTYTSGDPLAPQDSWPAQLVRALEPEIALTLVDNLAAQGQTSANVIAEQLRVVPGRRPDVVTLQVGVNDIISPDIDLDDYRTNIATILDALLDTVPAGRIFAVSTPDYTLTPHGGDYGTREAVRDEVHEANAILAEVAEDAGSPSSTSPRSATGSRTTRPSSRRTGSTPRPSSTPAGSSYRARMRVALRDAPR